MPRRVDRRPPKGAPPRSRPLMLPYYGIAPTRAQPLKKYGRRTVGGRERLHLVGHLGAAAARPETIQRSFRPQSAASARPRDRDSDRTPVL
jgi:hypothetical protein